MAGLQMLVGSKLTPLIWDSRVTEQHKNELYKSNEKGLTYQMDTYRNT